MRHLLQSHTKVHTNPGSSNMVSWVSPALWQRGWWVWEWWVALISWGVCCSGMDTPIRHNLGTHNVHRGHLTQPLTLFASVLCTGVSFGICINTTCPPVCFVLLSSIWKWRVAVEFLELLSHFPQAALSAHWSGGQLFHSSRSASERATKYLGMNPSALTKRVWLPRCFWWVFSDSNPLCFPWNITSATNGLKSSVAYPKQCVNYLASIWQTACVSPHLLSV